MTDTTVTVLLNGVPLDFRADLQDGLYSFYQIVRVPIVTLSLLTAGAATGDPQLWPGGSGFFDIWGTWNGASATLQQSPDGGTTWVSYDLLTFVSNGARSNVPIPPNRLVRVSISTPGVGTSISATLNRQG